jgi:putative ABC transport system permease protein
MLVVLIGGGNGLQYMMQKQIGGFATNSAMFFADRTGEAYRGFAKNRRWDMSYKDLTVIREQVKDIQYISPTLFNSSTAVKNERSGQFQILGVNPDYYKIMIFNVDMGRTVNDIDVAEQRKVCAIGTRVYETLFARGEDPVGQTVRLNGIYYTVTGVVSQVSSGINFGGDPAECIHIPVTTMQSAFRLGDVVHMIMITSKRGVSVSALVPEVENIIRKQHFISPTDKRALQVFDIEKQFNMFNNLFLGINILIWIVGIGTLLAGIIGVSNIMMVTVKERTQEIGVRRALGARPSQIISQILSETALLTGIAGIIGVALGVLILQILDMGVSGGGNTSGFMIPFQTAIGATVLLLVLSIIAGLAPAFRAMQIKAIDALRDE